MVSSVKISHEDKKLSTSLTDILTVTPTNYQSTIMVRAIGELYRGRDPWYYEQEEEHP